jgi:hypothetical protein
LPKADPQSTGIDPIILARFLVMPGVEPLLDAFGRIPPGPMRDSVIHLARTLADQYSNAPAGQSMPDPLLTAAGYVVTEAPRTADQLPAPDLKPKDAVPPNLAGPEVEVIRRRKAKQHPQQIAEETKIPRVRVDQIIAEAKRAGVNFPNIREAIGRPREHKPWHTSLDSMTGQGLSRVTEAAKARGITPQEYLRLKLLVVEMAMKGEQYPALMKASRQDQKTVSLWLSNARAAGLNVPYSTRWLDEAEAAEAAAMAQASAENASSPPPGPAMTPPDPNGSNVIRPARFYGPWSSVTFRGKSVIVKAAAKRDMTPDAYLDLQESIVRQREQGISPLQIAKLTGEGEVFVKDTLAHAKKHGAVYPPCAKGWIARATG